LKNQRMKNGGRDGLMPRAVIMGVVLLIVTILALVSATRSTNDLAAQASLINEAGSQRFRVERVALSALRLHTAEDEAGLQVARQELTDTLDDLVFHFQTTEYHPEHAESVPGAMDHNDLDLSSEAIERLDAIGVDELLKEYVARGRAVATAPSGELVGTSLADLQYVLDNERATLEAVDALVVELTMEVDEKKSRTVVFEQITMVALLVIIALAGAFLFVPLIRRLRAETTRRAESEQLIRAASVKFEELFRSNPDGVLVVDEVGVISSVNDTLEEMFGYSSEELVGQSVELLMPERFRERHPGFLASFMASPTRRQMGSGPELSGQTKAGIEFPIEIMLAPMSTEAGRRGVANVRDVTERKQAELEILMYAKRLERSNRELQDFAAIAAHDLQEPLRKVQAFGDRLAAVSGGDLSEAGRDYLERMQNASGRMRSLIDDLLTYSRVVTKAGAFVPVDLAGVMTEVQLTCQPLIEETGGRLIVGELPVIEADRTQMEQLLQNLIVNAFKFRRPDVPPVVEVSGELIGELRATDVKQLRLTITDNGIGFDEKYAEKIFKMFERLHGRDAYPGTGLGLAVCRKIVDRHNGEITAYGRPGEGSTFIVTLPISQPIAPSPLE